MAVGGQEEKPLLVPIFKGFWFLGNIPGHRQRRNLVATFDHSDIHGLVTA